MVTVKGKDISIVKQVTCRNCASILEYLPKDVKTFSKRDYTGCSDTFHQITCPECEDKINV
jgi:RNase P subunit RPR2